MAKARPYSDQQNWSNTYLTDPKLVEALGPFHVDVCCPPGMPWSTAYHMLVEGEVDGLTAPWGVGRAWMNPPYRGVLAWATRFVQHGGGGVVLLNGRSTETRATQLLMRSCWGVFLLDERLTFYQVTGEPWPGKWFPSLLIGMGRRDAIRLRNLPRHGFGGVFLKGPCWSEE